MSLSPSRSCLFHFSLFYNWQASLTDLVVIPGGGEDYERQSEQGVRADRR